MLNQLSSKTLRRMADIKDKIEDLRCLLDEISGDMFSQAAEAAKPKRKMSAAARAKISAAQVKRWAKRKKAIRRK